MSATVHCSHMADKKKRGTYGLGSLRLKGRIWHLKYHVDGVPRYESSKTSNKTKAAKILAHKIAEARKPHGDEFTTVGELLDDALEYYRKNRPKSFKDFSEPIIRAALKPYWGRYTVSQVTTGKLNAYQDKRIATGLAPATVNREMAVLRRAFNLGKVATPTKVREAPKFPMLPEDNVRKGFLRLDGYGKMLAALPEELRCLFVVGYHVGCREGELLRLKVSDVHLQEKQITLWSGETKNDQGRILPIYGDMAGHLERQIASVPTGCVWLFHRNGHRIKDFREAWDDARKAAGFSALRFHDLRRSAVRNLVRAGVPERVAMSISGHKTRDVFDRYNIVDGDDIADAGEKMEAFFKGEKK